MTYLTLPIMILLPNHNDFLEMRLDSILFHWPLQSLKQLPGTSLHQIQQHIQQKNRKLVQQYIILK